MSLKKRAINSDNIENWNNYKKKVKKNKNRLRKRDKDFINNRGELTKIIQKNFGHT